MNRVTLTAHDGHALAGYRFDPAGPPKACVVIAPAMAVPQSFYAHFVQHLAAQGFAVWSFDYRGTGESLKGGMRGAKTDLTDWYARDYDAVVNVAAKVRRCCVPCSDTFRANVSVSSTMSRPTQCFSGGVGASLPITFSAANPARARLTPVPSFRSWR